MSGSIDDLADAALERLVGAIPAERRTPALDEDRKTIAKALVALRLSLSTTRTIALRCADVTALVDDVARHIDETERGRP